MSEETAGQATPDAVEETAKKRINCNADFAAGTVSLSQVDGGTGMTWKAMEHFGRVKATVAVIGQTLALERIAMIAKAGKETTLQVAVASVDRILNEITNGNVSSVLASPAQAYEIAFMGLCNALFSTVYTLAEARDVIAKMKETAWTHPTTGKTTGTEWSQLEATHKMDEYRPVSESSTKLDADTLLKTLSISR